MDRYPFLLDASVVSAVATLECDFSFTQFNVEVLTVPVLKTNGIDGVVNAKTNRIMSFLVQLVVKTLDQPVRVCFKLFILSSAPGETRTPVPGNIKALIAPLLGALLLGLGRVTLLGAPPLVIGCEEE
jgi:hypothetical protein